LKEIRKRKIEDVKKEFEEWRKYGEEGIKMINS
jgi:hypothetical protein